MAILWDIITDWHCRRTVHKIWKTYLLTNYFFKDFSRTFFQKIGFPGRFSRTKINSRTFQNSWPPCIKLRHNKKICNHHKRHAINKLFNTKPPNNLICNFLSLQKRRFKLYCMVEINIFHQIQIDIKSTQIFIKIFWIFLIYQNIT